MESLDAAVDYGAPCLHLRKLTVWRVIEYMAFECIPCNDRGRRDHGGDLLLMRDIIGDIEV